LKEYFQQRRTPTLLPKIANPPKLTAEQKEDQADGNNLAWKLDDIDSIIEVLQQINKGEI